MPPTDSFAFLPDSPPPEVMAEVDAAWERSAGLVGDDLELRVRVGRITGGVRGELRVENTVLARLDARQVLALSCGDPLPLPR